VVTPLVVTVVACLAVILMTRPTLQRDVDDVPQPRQLVLAAKVSMLAAIIVGGWSVFVLVVIAIAP
jgi:hypothetical protein